MHSHAHADRIVANVKKLKERNAHETEIDCYLLGENHPFLLRAPGVHWRKPLHKGPVIPLAELIEKYGLET